jgi:hypothetical protein
MAAGDRRLRAVQRLDACLFLIVLIAFALWPTRAEACDCIGLPLPSTAIRTETPFIFEGRVLDIVERSEQTLTTTPRGASSSVRPLDRLVNFEVVRAWRGVQANRLSVSAELSDCMFAFRAGRSYLVFAYLDARQRAATTICTRTIEFEKAAPLIALLGAPEFVAAKKAP